MHKQILLRLQQQLQGQGLRPNWEPVTGRVRVQMGNEVWDPVWRQVHGQVGTDA